MEYIGKVESYMFLKFCVFLEILFKRFISFIIKFIYFYKRCFVKKNLMVREENDINK